MTRRSLQAFATIDVPALSIALMRRDDIANAAFGRDNDAVDLRSGYSQTVVEINAGERTAPMLFPPIDRYGLRSFVNRVLSGNLLENPEGLATCAKGGELVASTALDPTPMRTDRTKSRPRLRSFGQADSTIDAD